jgi:drug/metabolite transporter (DMT)-like permease
MSERGKRGEERRADASPTRLSAPPLQGGVGPAAGEPLLAVGDAWALASAVAFAVQIWRTEARAREVGPADTLPLLAVTVAVVAAIAVGAAAAADPGATAALVAHPETAVDVLAHADWPPVLWTGLASTDGVLLIEIVALRWVSSIDAAITYTLEPVLGALFAWAMLGERFGAVSFAGAAVILASALFAQVAGGGGAERGGEEGDP